jgi:hypothetical protein
MPYIHAFEYYTLHASPMIAALRLSCFSLINCYAWRILSAFTLETLLMELSNPTTSSWESVSVAIKSVLLISASRTAQGPDGRVPWQGLKATTKKQKHK